MAFTANVNWEVRTTGSDTNGGGYNKTATGGTDFSQQNAAQFAYTDLVIGATNTQITSVARPFTSVDVGNIINVVSGTGFTVQRVQIISVASNVATCDKAVGTAASTAGVGNLGGALATLVVALPLASLGAVVWVQAGTYTATTVATINGSCYVIGYGTVRGDNGVPTLAANFSSTNSTINVNTSSSQVTVKNFNFTKVGTAAVNGISTGSNYMGLTCVNCTFTSMSNCITGGNYYFMIYACSFINYTSTGITFGTNSSVTDNGMIDSCFFSTTAALGINYGISVVSAAAISVTNCIFNGGYLGISAQASRSNILVTNSSFLGMSLAAIEGYSVDPSTFLNTMTVRNCIMVSCSRGIYMALAPPAGLGTQQPMMFFDSNAFYSNTNGNYVSCAAGTNDIILTANPFVGTPNLALNSTAGAGAALQGTAWPQVGFFGTTTASYPSFGAAQVLPTGGGSTPSNYAYSG